MMISQQLKDLQTLLVEKHNVLMCQKEIEILREMTKKLDVELAVEVFKTVKESK